MASRQQQQKRSTLDEKARQGETVVPGGTGGKSLEAQEHLAQGRSRGGQLGTEGYKEMGRKGGLSNQSGGVAEDDAASFPDAAAAVNNKQDDPDFDIDEFAK